MLGYYVGVATATAALLVWASGQPHAAPASAAEEEGGSTSSRAAPLAPHQATAHFPPHEVSNLRVITNDTLARVQAGDNAGALTKAHGHISTVKSTMRCRQCAPPTRTPMPSDTRWAHC
jgi:hypothetical protein